MNGGVSELQKMVGLNLHRPRPVAVEQRIAAQRGGAGNVDHACVSDRPAGIADFVTRRCAAGIDA